MPRMIRADGSAIDGARFHCTDRYCDKCARARAQRVYACILQKLKSSLPISPDESGFRLVTLTIQKKPGLSAADLRKAIERLGRVQLKTHELLRRQDYCAERIEYHEAQGKVSRARAWRSELLGTFPPLTHWMGGGMSPKVNDQAKSAPISTLGRTTYAWAREITTGADGNGWHVHAHYLVPSRSDAERFVSAWLKSAKVLGIKADIRGQKISEPDKAEWDRKGDGSAACDAASYITHYITKGVDSNKMDDGEIMALVRGTKGMRQYDAGGSWRPLGIGKTRPDDYVAVERVEWSEPSISTDATITWNLRALDAKEFFANGATYWQALNQYRTNLTNDDRQVLALKSSVIEFFEYKFDGEITEKTKLLAEFAIKSGLNIGESGDIFSTSVGEWQSIN